MRTARLLFRVLSGLRVHLSLRPQVDGLHDLISLSPFPLQVHRYFQMTFFSFPNMSRLSFLSSYLPAQRIFSDTDQAHIDLARRPVVVPVFRLSAIFLPNLVEVSRS